MWKRKFKQINICVFKRKIKLKEQFVIFEAKFNSNFFCPWQGKNFIIELQKYVNLYKDIKVKIEKVKEINVAKYCDKLKIKFKHW